MSDKTEFNMGEMHYYKSILELMGETPLVRLSHIASGCAAAPGENGDAQPWW